LQITSRTDNLPILPRRRFTAGAIGLIAGAAATRSRLGRAADRRNLRLGYISSADSPLSAGGTAMADAVARRSAGRIRIRQFPAGALGDEMEMLTAVQLGTLDLRDFRHCLSLQRTGSRTFGARWTIGDNYRQRFAAKDLVALAWGEHGLRHITNAKRPILTPDDLRGLKLRLPQSDVMLLGFRALGADASPSRFRSFMTR
jgi:TRAP-type C4-dicarboxylate transport system substrate-binding protein